MADWADVQDMYAGDGRDEDFRAYRDYQPSMGRARGADSRITFMRVEVPGANRWMKRRGLLRLLTSTRRFRETMRALLAQRQEQFGQWQTINGAYSTCELSVYVNLRPPRLRGFRHKEAVRQAMLSGYTRPSTSVNLDYVIQVVCRGLCEGEAPLVRRQACINHIDSGVYFAEYNSVEVRLYRRNQMYDMKQM